MPKCLRRSLMETRYSRQEVLEALEAWPLSPNASVRVIPSQTDPNDWELAILEMIEPDKVSLPADGLRF